MAVNAPSRRHVLFIAALLLPLVPLRPAEARTEKLDGSLSHDGRYRIEAREHGKHPDISYDLIRQEDGAVLHRFRSSYQPEEGELPDWSWNHSCDAAVRWSPDDHYFAIGEAAHRYIGEVQLAAINRHRVREIFLPETTMLRATSREWHRQMFHLDGWVSKDRLSLDFAGRRNEDRDVSYFKMSLRMRAARATLIFCRNVSDGR
jgi:hypothetical protein